MKFLVVLLFGASIIATVISSPVKSCNGDGGIHEHSEDINTNNCEKLPCKLKRKTSVTLDIKFKPDTEVKTLKNTVFAKILGIPFPFIGVDGTDACDHVYLPDGSKAGCPLKAGEDYVYKNSFKVLEIYPKLRLIVHWALTAQGDKDVLCFEVPAKITS